MDNKVGQPECQPVRVLASINALTKIDVLKFPGVGPKSAAEFLRVRSELDGFKDLSQLRSVPLFNKRVIEAFEQKYGVAIPVIPKPKCKKETCGCAARPSGWCGRHKKGAAIEAAMAGLDKRGLTIGSLLLAEYQQGKKNPLKPTLRWSPLAENQHMTASEWLAASVKYQSMLLAVLDAEEYGAKRVDQRNRAKEMARLASELLAEYRHPTVALMDGHLAHFMAILQEIQALCGAEAVDRIRFVIVDIDHEVNEYHRSFLANVTGVACVDGDITAVECAPSTLVYMNFCGIVGSIREVKAYLQRPGLRDGHLMISFSTARAASKRQILNELVNACPKPATLAVLATQRKDFRTVVFRV